MYTITCVNQNTVVLDFSEYIGVIWLDEEMLQIYITILNFKNLQ